MDKGVGTTRQGLGVSDNIDTGLRTVLGQVLGLSPERLTALAADSPLLGALPELDSMAIATLFAGIEDHFGILFDDTELTGEAIADYGNLLALVRAKCAP